MQFMMLRKSPPSPIFVVTCTVAWTKLEEEKEIWHRDCCLFARLSVTEENQKIFQPPRMII